MSRPERFFDDRSNDDLRGHFAAIVDSADDAIVTKTLVFMGEGSDTGVGVPAGFGGKMFRAYDKATGKSSGRWSYRVEPPARP